VSWETRRDAARQQNVKTYFPQPLNDLPPLTTPCAAPHAAPPAHPRASLKSDEPLPSYGRSPHPLCPRPAFARFSRRPNRRATLPAATATSFGRFSNWWQTNQLLALNVNKCPSTPRPPPMLILKMTLPEYIRIRGARVHNLKNISLSLPHNQLTVITGVSGSGKSSLAFDTTYAEGQRRYVESLSGLSPSARKIPAAIPAPPWPPPPSATIFCACCSPA